jgi:hypothetical protein
MLCGLIIQCERYRGEFRRVIGRYEDAIKKELMIASEQAVDLKTAILEDTWIGKYLAYARLHNLNVNSDTLFQDCNRHYIDCHTTSHVFDCNCGTYLNADDEDDVGTSYGYDYGCGHVWTGDRCSYGTKMHMEYDVHLPIGLIEKPDPLNYCRLTKW